MESGHRSSWLSSTWSNTKAAISRKGSAKERKELQGLNTVLESKHDMSLHDSSATRLAKDNEKTLQNSKKITYQTVDNRLKCHWSSKKEALRVNLPVRVDTGKGRT